MFFFFEKKKNVAQCAVSVAALALSPMKDGLQQQGRGM